MKLRAVLTVVAVLLASVLLIDVPQLSAADQSGLIRDVLRQQSDAGQAGCTGVQRALAAGTDARLVVRTAVEIGYNSCQMIRCALEAKVDRENMNLCEKVIRGAVEAAVPVDVISRCSSEVCDPAAVAAILGETSLDPYYCYFSDRPLTAPELLPPPPIIDRSAPPAQASPFAF
jgi:hypothetical protein